MQGALVWGAGKIKEAINQGAKLDYCNQRGLTLLHLSAAAGNINMVSSILKLQIIPVDKADQCVACFLAVHVCRSGSVLRL